MQMNPQPERKFDRPEIRWKKLLRLNQMKNAKKKLCPKKKMSKSLPNKVRKKQFFVKTKKKKQQQPKCSLDLSN